MKFYNIAILFVSCFVACINGRSQGLTRTEKRDEILKNIVPPKLSPNTFRLTDFGARGDSMTNCKPAFDKAIAACKKKGGGRIMVPSGIYIVNGPIHMVSNTAIDLAKGAKLVFGTNPDHYLPAVPTSWEGTFLYNYSPLIYAYQAENIAITGEGTIDGNGKEGFAKWYDLQKPDQQLSREMNHSGVPVSQRQFGKGHYLRPQLIQFFECKNILVEGVTIQNSPFWTVHFLKSENIIARKVKFNAFNKNNDGFDPEYSRNILIEDIDFNNADDNVAVKAGRDQEGRLTAIPSENIIIRNSRFKGLHGLVIGSEMSAGVQNVFVENCTYGGYCKRGIYLKSNPDRGGFIRDIYVNDVTFGEVEDAVFITSFYHGEGKGYETDIRNVYLDNVKFTTATNAGLVIQGYPTKKVSNIQFSNIKIDSCGTAISFTNAEQVIFSNVVIGKEITVPSAANHTPSH
ncbi:glycoside hydrolase family 28 protein [Filimonas effusa]|uniref:Glycoside hydrolase family 28 protein n=1 Tax=Filimonas effusa TaxID=2508721 RepID=A0A4V1MAR7_9BACT|nr:glycoside hydrolase family 28 protein [Filimonas effusa]RXK86816.1 glycoside hydrolase family 28 protein [Filimonas effusa]